TGQGSDLPFSTFKDRFLTPIGPDPFPRKIREWTTVDTIISYTFHLPAPVAETQVAGVAKNGGKNANSMGSDKNVIPVSTAEFSLCGWKTWLNGTTITFGMNNIFDLDPPFSSGTIENGYEEANFAIKGRFWYVSLKKRF